MLFTAARLTAALSMTFQHVTLEHCATHDMVADPMAKKLGKIKQDKHV